MNAVAGQQIVTVHAKPPGNTASAIAQTDHITAAVGHCAGRFAGPRNLQLLADPDHGIAVEPVYGDELTATGTKSRGNATGGISAAHRVVDCSSCPNLRGHDTQPGNVVGPTP